MTGVVIATHGNLAIELLQTAKFIAGELPSITALTINPSESIDDMQKAIRKAIKEVDQGNGVLILTDMFGGTPANMTLPFLDKDKVEVITGVNLPMLIKLAQNRMEEKSLENIASEVVEYSRKSINQATAILE